MVTNCVLFGLCAALWIVVYVLHRRGYRGEPDGTHTG